MSIKEVRKKRIQIRVFDDEKDKLLELCDGDELAKWMRETCLGQKPKHRIRPPKVDPNLIRQISWIGNNMNQIARVTNSLSSVNSLSIIAELSNIESKLDQILELHSVSKIS
jgi:hypothetical protein